MLSLEQHLLVQQHRWGERPICTYQSTELLSVLLIDIAFILDLTFYFDANPEQDLVPTLKLGKVNNRPFKGTVA